MHFRITATVQYWAFTITILVLQGCGLHQPTLINNAKNPSLIDLKSNGVLAYELFEPQDMKVEFWARNKETGDKYQLDQAIDNGSSWRIGVGPVSLFEKVVLNENTNRSIYLYELPPGTYDLRYFRIEGTELRDKRAYTPKIETSEFRIVPHQVTYIGSTVLWGTWGTLGLGFNTKIEFKTIDRFAPVDSILKQQNSDGVKEMAIVKNIIPIQEIK